MRKILFLLLFPIAAVAQQSIEATDNLNEGRVKINENFTDVHSTQALEDSTNNPATTAYVRRNAMSLNSSLFYSGQRTYQVWPIHTGGIGSRPFEIFNTGNANSSSETRNLVPVIGGRHGGNAILARNVEYDHANQKWITPYQDADAYGSSLFEAGGEAPILHATPSGVNFSDVPHEILLASANGTDGPTGQKMTSGYFLQSKAPIFIRYSALGTYDAAATNNTYNPSTATHPLVWASASEAKGTDNVYYAAEANSNSSSAWGGFAFRKSRGTLGSPTIAVTNEIVGRLEWTPHDGADYDQVTSAIDAVTRGTMASNSVGSELRFLTSPSTTANLAVRMALGHDGAIKNYTPWRYDVTAITTIPDYTGNGFAPALSTGTVAQIQPASSTNGGIILQGFTVSGTNTANAFIFRGVQGHTSPTGANTVFAAIKHNGTTGFADIAATEIGFQFRNNATVLTEVLGNGKTGFGATTPHSRVQTTSFATGYVAKTGAYTLTDADYTVEVTSGTHTQTLPTAVGISGRQYVITNSGSGTVTVGTTSSQTFVNVTATPTTLTLAQFETAIVQSNGANWLRLK